MSTPDLPKPADAEWPTDAAISADWRRVEAFVDELQAAAHVSVEAGEFYRQLLNGCVTLLAAEGGAVWLPWSDGNWKKQASIGAQVEQSGAQQVFLERTAQSHEPLLCLPRSEHSGKVVNPSDWVRLGVAIRDTADVAHVQAIVELLLRPGGGPELEKAWQELLATVAGIASEYHVYQQLYALREERAHYDHSLGMLRRLLSVSDLRSTAFEVANEGRRLLACDRLSVVMRRGKHWQVLAASGVDRLEPRSDAVKQLQHLAAGVAAWGEPLELSEATADQLQELPAELLALVEQHLEDSHARQLVVVPKSFAAQADTRQPRDLGDLVLVAEQFAAGSAAASRQAVLELAESCAPALQRALQLDRFPVSVAQRWASRWAELIDHWGITKLGAGVAALLALVAALILVPVNFEVSAPATLRPVVERDVFAAADGRIAEVKISHGERVEAGQVLAVLHDAQLSLERQQVAGEIETTRKRLEAIAIQRTDRTVREQTSNDELPLAAEAELLRQKLASLEQQAEILNERRDALTVRSPIAGTLLTLDVQNRLLTRPVQRGQVLFTVADLDSGWLLLAEVPQQEIAALTAAQQAEGDQLPVRFRLAGGSEQVYRGRVQSISTSLVLNPETPEQESPDFEVVVAVDDEQLPQARPAMSAEVRIDCGHRSLGYVWLHDVWEAVYRWVVF